MKYNDLFVKTNLPEPFTKEELNSYFLKMYAGDKIARKEIIEHSIKLVLSVSLRFSNTPYEIDELVSIGLEGLIKSVDTFDINKGITFSSYATRCITNEILMFMRKWRKTFRDDSLERDVSYAKDQRMLLKDIIVDEEFDLVLDYEKQEIYKTIREELDLLPKRDAIIVRKYFGFETGEPIKQQDIAYELKTSQSFISSKIKKVLEHIKIELQKQELIEQDIIPDMRKEKSIPRII